LKINPNIAHSFKNCVFSFLVVITNLEYYFSHPLKTRLKKAEGMEGPAQKCFQRNFSASYSIVPGPKKREKQRNYIGLLIF